MVKAICMSILLINKQVLNVLRPLLHRWNWISRMKLQFQGKQRVVKHVRQLLVMMLLQKK